MFTFLKIIAVIYLVGFVASWAFLEISHRLKR